MNISRYIIYFLFSAVLALASCSDDDSTSANGSGSSTMSAKIDGSDWTASINGATNSNGLIAFAGQDGNVRQIQLRVMATAAGTYDIGGTVFNANMGQMSEGTKVWTSGLGMGTGKVIFTKLSASEAEGTFTLSLSPVTSTSASGTRNATEGKFSLKFN